MYFQNFLLQFEDFRCCQFKGFCLAIFALTKTPFHRAYVLLICFSQRMSLEKQGLWQKLYLCLQIRPILSPENKVLVQALQIAFVQSEFQQGHDHLHFVLHGLPVFLFRLYQKCFGQFCDLLVFNNTWKMHFNSVMSTEFSSEMGSLLCLQNLWRKTKR